MPACFQRGFVTKNANGSAFGHLSKQHKVRIPSMGIAGRPSSVPFVEIQQMRAAHEAGEPIAAIARRFGYDYGVVRSWCQHLQRVFA